jgi:hypothetical protein
MQVVCSRCQTILEYSHQRPSFCSQCGTALDQPPTATQPFDPTPTAAEGKPSPAGSEIPPERVGGYRLLRSLGAGGMGAVYEAEDTASGRRVALKLIAPDYADSTDAVERFRREGRLASTLSHPRCVFVLAADEEAGRPYIVMELMPGRTLGDLVAEQGPMEPATAVKRILDVIEGLQEAHRLGFIHRDVKPSNCFLDAEGRVKVGDFGLAKSLAPVNSLTRTGSFLGTLLFAAPEQIKGEPVDAQTDLYAVAATLYYLLTGRAPFDGGDAAATLARTVSDPAPSMRRLRSDLDPDLDLVVLRGLERDRARRWRGLAEFRAALLPFRPEPLPFAPLRVRFVAYLLDFLFIALTGALLLFLLVALGMQVEAPDAESPVWGHEPGDWPGMLLGFLYFALLEGLWGASLGKRLLRLRVQRSSGHSRPGLARILLRTALCEGLPQVGVLAWVGCLLFLPSSGSNAEWARNAPGTFLLLSLMPLIGMIGGSVLLLAPMRARNGYRGLHEWLSGTQVVQLPRPAKRLDLAGQPPEWPAVRPREMPEALGPFLIRGALRWDSRVKVLLGQDRSLGRSVWLWLRPRKYPSLSATRREVSRPTRLRWLAYGQHGDWQWDAFMAFPGGPLPPLIGGQGESWARILPLLEELAGELAVASAEGTLPIRLLPIQVWVGPDGQMQLLDLPLGRAPDRAVEIKGPNRALALLASVAALALEGQPRPPGDLGPVWAPVPLHARPILDRLLGGGNPYGGVAEFQADLKAVADRPAEVARGRRTTHLVILTALLSVGLVFMLSAGWFLRMSTFLAIFIIHENEQRLRDLEQASLLEFSVSALNADPRNRLRGFVQLDADFRLRDELKQRIAYDNRQYQARLESAGWVGRWLSDEMGKEEFTAPGSTIPREPINESKHVRRHAARAVNSGQLSAKSAHFWLTMLAVWPVAWIVWAFLARGGLSYRLAGIALVRRDGRLASRWRCAWRAILVWAPVTGLLGLSLFLESHYWSMWQAGEPPRWLLPLSSAIWYTAVLLLAAYVALAFWRPSRAPHDRLSGIYLVPR